MRRMRRPVIGNTIPTASPGEKKMWNEDGSCGESASTSPMRKRSPLKTPSSRSPMLWRTCPFAPSLPTSHGTVTASTLPSPRVSSAVTCPSSWVSPVRVTPRSISTPSAVSRSVRMRSVSVCAIVTE